MGAVDPRRRRAGRPSTAGRRLSGRRKQRTATARGAGLPAAGPADMQRVDVDSLRLIRPRSVGVEPAELWALGQVERPDLLTRLGVNGALCTSAAGRHRRTPRPAGIRARDASLAAAAKRSRRVASRPSAPGSSTAARTHWWRIARRSGRTCSSGTWACSTCSRQSSSTT